MKNTEVAMLLGLPVVLLGLAVVNTKGKLQVVLLGTQLTLLIVQIGFFVASFL